MNDLMKRLQAERFYGAPILEEVIDYIGQLQARVEELEKQVQTDFVAVIETVQHQNTPDGSKTTNDPQWGKDHPTTAGD